MSLLHSLGGQLSLQKQQHNKKGQIISNKSNPTKKVATYMIDPNPLSCISVSKAAISLFARDIANLVELAVKYEERVAINSAF